MKVSRRTHSLLVMSLLVAGAGTAAAQGSERFVPYTDTIPGALLSFVMLPVPAGTITVSTATGPLKVPVAAFWIAKSEITWDMYDIFAFRLDVPRDERPKIDISARPSRPYGAPDKGYGHSGFPAIGMTATAAEAFARWISAKTGHSYRIATDAEWTHAAELAFGTSPLSRQRLDATAWTRENADAQTHAVGLKLNDRIGVQDLFGNAAEWVTTADSGFALRGGSYRDPAAQITTVWSARQDPTWNQTDPQIPKSRWWLSDAPFTGIRLVRVP
ncbi:MAG: SUMF1/EgtB/PvdO family nonheme iron enzyme [Gemmatimonadales bacterium]